MSGTGYTYEEEQAANGFVAELISTSGTPVQRMMIGAAAERMGLVKNGELAIVDGRINSDVAARLVAHAVVHAEQAGAIVSKRVAGNRAKRRAHKAKRRALKRRQEQQKHGLVTL